jgi:hypothetical protein
MGDIQFFYRTFVRRLPFLVELRSNFLFWEDTHTAHNVEYLFIAGEGSSCFLGTNLCCGLDVHVRLLLKGKKFVRSLP